MVNEEIKRIAKESIPLLKKNGVVKAGIFGSYATQKQKKLNSQSLQLWGMN